METRYRIKYFTQTKLIIISIIISTKLMMIYVCFISTKIEYGYVCGLLRKI